MATSRTNIGSKFQNGDIPSNSDFEEIFDSFVHKDEDKADFHMVETGTDDQHYVTPALLRTGLQNIGIITGNSYMPFKEHFDNFGGTTLSLEKLPVNFSVKAFKNGQLLLEGEDYTINYDTATITFSSDVDNRNIEVDYWYKNLSPNPGGGSNEQIDFTSFLHTSGNETKNGILTFNNTSPASTSGIVLKNSGADANAKVLDVTVSGPGSGASIQNTATGIGVKVSNSGAGVGAYFNSTAASTGDILQVAKDGIVKVKIEDDGIITAPKYVTSGGTATQFVKGDGSLDSTTYPADTDVIHTTGNESKDGALTLSHNDAAQDVLTINKNNSANCLKLVQNSNSNATTSTWDTSTANADRKAISIQKQGDENAFITHEGDVTANSFSTLTSRANLTDGILSLSNSSSPTATPGQAKLYAKTDGSTDLYLMGSDGIERMIGGVVDLSGKENKVTAGTTSQYYRGDKSWQTLDKTAVGLGNVDNTSDLNKPLSTATQTALNSKQATLVSGSNIKTINGTALVGSGDISVAIDSNVMHLTGSLNESADGRKTFTGGVNIQNSIQMLTGSQIIYSQNISSQGATGVFSYRVNDKFALKSSLLTAKTSALFDTDLLDTSDKTFTFPNKSGVLALTSDIPIQADLSTYAKLASPALTGIPTAPTATTGTNTTQVATTAFVTTAFSGAVLLTGAQTITGDKTFDNSTLTRFNTNKTTPGGSAITINNTGTQDGIYISSNNGGTSITSQSTTGRSFSAALNGSGQALNLFAGSTATGTIFNGQSAFGSTAPFIDYTVQTMNAGSYVPAFKVDRLGNINATTFAKIGGSSSQFLKADGSVDSSSYLSSFSPALTGVPTAPTAVSGTNTTQIATTAFVQSVARPYKSYVATMTQTGTNPPVANVLENTLGGTVVWGYLATGIYTGTLSGAFPTNKTTVFLSLAGTNGAGYMTEVFGRQFNNDSVMVGTVLNNSTATAIDDRLNLISIEIRVYN